MKVDDYMRFNVRDLVVAGLAVAQLLAATPSFAAEAGCARPYEATYDVMSADKQNMLWSGTVLGCAGVPASVGSGEAFEFASAVETTMTASGRALPPKITKQEVFVGFELLLQVSGDGDHVSAIVTRSRLDGVARIGAGKGAMEIPNLAILSEAAETALTEGRGALLLGVGDEQVTISVAPTGMLSRKRSGQ